MRAMTKLSKKVCEKLKYGSFEMLSKQARVYSFEVAVGDKEYEVRFHDGDWGPEFPFS